VAHGQIDDGDMSWDDVLKHTGSSTGCRRQSQRNGAAEMHGEALGAGPVKLGSFCGTGSAALRGAGVVAQRVARARGSGRRRYGFSCTTALSSMRPMNE
jgi:hypothetical protein